MILATSASAQASIIAAFSGTDRTGSAMEVAINLLADICWREAILSFS